MIPQTRFAIYDPDQNKFLSRGSTYNNFIWTDKVASIWSYVDYESHFDNNRIIQHEIPNVYIAEICFVINSIQKAARRPAEERCKKQIEIYNELLPEVERDIEALSKKDWAAFKEARRALIDAGIPVISKPGYLRG